MRVSTSVFVLITAILLFVPSMVWGTFSIVAVDTLTRQVGVAAASCVQGGGIADICAVIPDKGGMIAQAKPSFTCLLTGQRYLLQAQSAQAIVDELVDMDPQCCFRQYGIVTLDSLPRGAAYSGSLIPEWNGWIVGSTYSIQGNCLAGEHILKQMETAFLQTSGPLPLKLMAALQAAKENGADTRCDDTSSLCACIKVANADDRLKSLSISIEVADVAGDPIDSLQVAFDAVYVPTHVDHDAVDAPASFSLLHNHPNPFNHATTIRFFCPHRADVFLRIYDVLGKRVKTLLEGEQRIGWHLVSWQGDDDRGRMAPTGVYICRLQTGSGTRCRKISLIR